LFWFIPMINYLSTFLEVTTTRVVYRKGLFGQQRREVSISSIQNVELTKGRSITITAEGQEPLVLTGIPKHKLVAVEIDRLAASI
jgi:phosphotransferase system HPr-like phosphotransfer protein